MSKRGPRRRSEQRRARQARLQRPPRRRWPLVVGVLVAAAVVAAVAVFVAGDDGDDTAVEIEPIVRRGSTEVEGTTPIEITDEPDGYRIVYRVHERGLPLSSEVVEVDRPFDAEVRGYTGERGTGSLTSHNATTLGRLASGIDIDHDHDDDEDDDHSHDDDEDDDHTHALPQQGDAPTSPAQQRTVLAIGPTLAGPDYRLAPVVDEALERDLLEAREQREVLGRRCQVYRFGTSVVGGVLRPPGDPADEYADACFDAAGLLLEEWWVVEGEPIRHRVAVEVEEQAPSGVAQGLADEETSIPVGRGGGSFQEMRPDSSPPGPFFVAPQPPPGFEHVGRFTVIPPQAESFTSPDRRSYIVTSTADVWRRGIDIVVLDQGGTLGRVKPFEPDPDGVPVELGALGTGESLVGLGGNTVRVVRDPGDFVRVYGTLPTAELAAFAATLVETEGTEIVLLDPPEDDEGAEDEGAEDGGEDGEDGGDEPAAHTHDDGGGVDGGGADHTHDDEGNVEGGGADHTHDEDGGVDSGGTTDDSTADDSTADDSATAGAG